MTSEPPTADTGYYYDCTFSVKGEYKGCCKVSDKGHRRGYRLGSGS